MPERNGSFTIPAITIEVDGRSYSTQPVALTVRPSSATDGSSEAEKLDFVELLVPKKTVYLGEAIPIEFRLYVDAASALATGGHAGNRGRGIYPTENARTAPT